ncbi:MAG: hypothetical protein IKL00_11225 [Oscillospiraceae bacterium]|nr:hypothetical protein [Oscillospiraceae bacterium]
MEQNHDKNSGQEQNYDYIFEELDRQELLRSGKPVITYPDGKTEAATGKKLFKAWLPALIFIAACILLVIASNFNPMTGMVIFGMIFMAVAVFVSHVGGGKFRPQPMMYLFFIVGLAISYAGAATIIYEEKPFFDMELFKQRSLLGFGIGTAILGICLIAGEIIRMRTCRTKVQATCKEIKSIGRINGRPFGTITWTYDWEFGSYTTKTHNTIIGELCEGMSETVYINPAHPERIRLKGQRGKWGWGVFYMIAGIFAACFLSGMMFGGNI